MAHKQRSEVREIGYQKSIGRLPPIVQQGHIVGFGQ